MKRNLILIAFLITALFLANNSIRKIMAFREASKTVRAAEERLGKLRAENEQLKKELEYKSSDQFAEEEIRNKLGLAKEDETVFILPADQDDQKSAIRELIFDKSKSNNQQSTKPNWIKWRKVFLGS